MNNPLDIYISIIVPIYKVEKYLHQCIDSIITQTLDEIEIILVDDASPDRCPIICDEYARKDKRIKVLHNSSNQGYGYSINRGIGISRGEYIGIVESDDWIEPDMFEILYSGSKVNKSEIVKGSFFKEYGNGTNGIHPLYLTKGQKIYEIKGYKNLDLMLYESSIWSAIYNHNFIINNNIRMLETPGASYQDEVWKIETYVLAESITLINKPVYHYRVMNAESSSSNKKNYDAIFTNFKIVKIFLLDHKLFGEYKNTYYILQIFDAVFHYNRLDNKNKTLFISKYKNVLREAREQGITFESIPQQYLYTSEIKDIYDIANSKKKPMIKIFLKQKIRTLALSFYHSFPGNYLWRTFRKIINYGYFRKVFSKALGVDAYLYNYMSISDMYFPSENKNALIVIPFWGENAVKENINHVCRIIKSLGYNLFLVIYGHGQVSPKDNLWSHAFALRPMNPHYGNPDIHKIPGGYDTNLIDDWVGDDLLTFISILDRNCKFSLCFCNYVFLSKVFLCFSNHTLKLLYTHDVFTERNKRLYNNGISYPYFGTNVAEEKKGLDRADCIFAIQENDNKFFKGLTERPVVTMPYVPEKKYIKYFYYPGILKVGYMASANPPNIKSIKEYIKFIEGRKDIELYIGGPVSLVMDTNDFNIHKLGIIESLDEFYSRYDVYINPDTFESGLKVKTVEILSYGRPLICTKESSMGIDVKSSFHMAENIKQVVDFTLRCINNIDLLNKMSIESIKIYDRFSSFYSTKNILKKILSPQ
jgi:glycosyltransferase involved in cell wall biosynthesis